VNLSAFNVQPTVEYVFAANVHDGDDGDDGEAQLVTVPRSQFLTADDMKQADCIETLASDDDDYCL